MIVGQFLPTRGFVVRLPGFQMSPKWGRGMGSHGHIISNWSRVLEKDTQKLTTDIAIYYAITRFRFEIENSVEEWLLNEDGGRGFTLQLYGKGASVEAIVGAFFQGADFYASVAYRKNRQRKIDYDNPVFPPVVLEDIDLYASSKNAMEAIEVLRKIKQVLLFSLKTEDIESLLPEEREELEKRKAVVQMRVHSCPLL